MNSEVKDFISNCTACNDYLQNNSKDPLISHPIPSKPRSQIAMDIMAVFDRNYLITADFYFNFWELDTLPNNPTAASVIPCCKRNFSRHGIPDVVAADIAWQFDCKEFEQFTQEWEFECSPSDPYHSQSNEKAESAVKITKKLIKKTEQDGSDSWKAILDWRNTPTKEVGSSPTQRLMSRRTKTQLPTADDLLKPHVETNVKVMLTMKRQRSQKYYDKTKQHMNCQLWGKVM